jgi:UDP-GlcNAc:undecaprenyl-phosphate GlcNAc-1-phosphate transferase
LFLTEYVVGFCVALAVCAGILPAVIRFAHRLGVVDAPGGRRSHSGQIPRLGGIGVYLGFVGGVGTALLMVGQAPSLGDPSTEFPWAGAGIGATIAFAAGLIDDFRQLRPRTKFLLQLIAAAVAVGFGVRIDSVMAPVGGPIAMGALAPFVTVAWILVVTNAMNLIDGLDGLAGGLALIVTITMAFVSLAMGQFGVVACSVGLAGALIGFLWYNFNPARIFMGDGGSQFLGFVLAILSIRGSSKSATVVALALPILVLGVPLLDLSTTVARRAFSGERPGADSLAGFLKRISKADSDHLHHNLVKSGLTARRAVLSLYLIASIFALSGYFSLARNSLPIAALLLLVCLGSIVVIKLLPLSVRGGTEPSAAPTKESLEA